MTNELLCYDTDMENIAIFLAVFAISFFTITSVGSDRAIQTYNKLGNLHTLELLVGPGEESKAAVLSSLYKPNVDQANKITSSEIVIKSIDKTESDDVNEQGIKVKKVSIYLVFANPKLKKEGSDWRMHVSADVKTKDANGKKTKFLNGIALQEINNKYSYELDSGAFVFNVNLSAGMSGEYTSTFVVNDVFSGKKDQKTVTIKI